MLLRTRLVGGLAAATLGIFVAGPAAFANTGSPPAAPTPTTTTVPPTVTNAGNNYTVSLPGIGTLAFALDPTTGAVTAMTATVDAGGSFVASVPKLTEEGVRVTFTGPSAGQATVLTADIDHVDGVTVVTARQKSLDASTTSTTEPDHEKTDKGKGDDHHDNGSSGNADNNPSSSAPSGTGDSGTGGSSAGGQQSGDHHNADQHGDQQSGSAQQSGDHNGGNGGNGGGNSGHGGKHGDH